MYRYRKNVDIVAAVVIAVLGCAAVVSHMPSPVLIILGVCLFISPGYVWSEVLLSPTVAALERVVVAVGLAFMVPVLGGLALHVAGVLLYRYEWIGLLAGATIVGSVVLAIQRATAAEPPAARQRTDKQAEKRRLMPLRHVFAFGLAAVIAMGAVALAVVGAEAQKSPGFTQLWLTPPRVGALQATLGVTNQQGVAEEYRLVLRRKGRASETWNLTLSSGATWERKVKYTTKYLMTADLYLSPDLNHPFRVVDNSGTAVKPAVKPKKEKKLARLPREH